MTDLSKLFIIKPPVQSRPELNQYQPIRKNLFGNNSQNIPAPTYQPSNIKSSASYLPSIKKTQKQLAKTSVQSQALLDEIQYFKKLSKQQFYQKAFFMISIPLTLMSFMGILNKKIAFQLIQVGISLLILNSYIIIQSRTLKIFLKYLPYITYLALIYDIITVRNLSGQYTTFLTNLPPFIVSLFFTFNFFVWNKFQYLSQKNIRNIEINLDAWRTCKYFGKKYVHRLKNLKHLVKFIGLINMAAIFGIVLALILTNNGELFNILAFQTSWLKIFAIYWVLDLFAFSIIFLGKQISFFTLKHKFYQVHVFMNLLRLKSDKTNQTQTQKIYQRCLFQLARQLKVNHQYLDTPVKVNYAINSYCDILESFAESQIKQLNSKIYQICLKVEKNNKNYRSQKSWKQDLFIKPRKYVSQFINDLLIFQMIQRIQSKKQLLLILVKLSKQSPTRTKIIEGLQQVVQTISKTQKNLEVTFKTGLQRLMEWKSQLNLLIGQIQNGKAQMTLSKISGVDEHGWCHYQGRKVLNANRTA